MKKILEELYNSKKILDHGMDVGKELAYVLSGGDTNLDKEVTEDQMYQLELDSFVKHYKQKKLKKKDYSYFKNRKTISKLNDYI